MLVFCGYNLARIPSPTRISVFISKAIITAAAPNQRTLPLQNLVDQDGKSKPVLRILVEEAHRAGISEIGIVVSPDDERAYRGAIGETDGVSFIAQSEPLGYGHAVYCARDWAQGEPFLHMIGDHIYLSQGQFGCAQQLVQQAQNHSCAVSAVQPTRENLLPFFGAVGGSRVKGSHDLYAIETVLEKPTPTLAEQTLLVPGLRTGHYLCFFGMHVLTPTVMEILASHVAARRNGEKVALSPTLSELATREKYLAFEAQGRRYPLDTRYGLLTAQLALALSGRDRDEVLSNLCEMLAQRGLETA